MKIKKIISSLIALSMTMCMTCMTVFADDTSNVSEQYNFVYTDKTFNSDAGIATLALDQYEPNDIENPKSLDTIYAKRHPLNTVNASLSNVDDEVDGYSFAACTNNYDDIEIVDELVVLLGGLSSGDKVVMMITTDDYQEIASGVIDGSLTSGAYITIPMATGVSAYANYNIFLTLTNDSNSEVSYTLQVASRYVHDTQTFYPNPSSIYNQTNDNYSRKAYIHISESQFPSSAIVDSIFYSGNIANNNGGRVSTIIVKIEKDSEEIYGSLSADYIENLTSRNIALVGTWYISFRQNMDAPHTFSNITFRFDYTYDILAG